MVQVFCPSAAGSDEVLAHYLMRVDAGEKPQREELIAAYPHFAEELQAYFRNADVLDKIVCRIRMISSRK